MGAVTPPVTPEARTVLTACADGVAILTLNRPESRNALDMTMRRDLEAALAALDADPEPTPVALSRLPGEELAPYPKARSSRRVLLHLGERQRDLPDELPVGHGPTIGSPR